MLRSNAENLPSLGLYSMINAHQTPALISYFPQYNTDTPKRQAHNLHRVAGS
jgi:hypothetical protein